jgi:NAD(P)-dependent dehydrogenase (short-subunit alcohol dehydrogenase family)
MRWSPDQIGDHIGRTVVVTGANSGIGLEVARAFAGRGARVVLAVRSPDNGAAAAQQLAGLPGQVQVEQLDLASLASVRDFAERIDRPIDVLVNNAGVMAPPRHRTTADGHELQFGTNHLGHFALTGLLLPQLRSAAAPRITTVSSIAHHRGDARVVEGNPPEHYGAQTAYGQSKLANLLFAFELARRAAAAHATLVSTAAHPGVSRTNLFTSPDGMGGLNPVLRRMAPLVMRGLLPGPAQGAEAILYAATTAESGSYTGPQRFGETRGPVGPARMSEHAQDPTLAAALWERSEALTGVTIRL